MDPNPLLAEVDRWLRNATALRGEVVDPSASRAIGALITAVAVIAKICAGDTEVACK